MSTSKDKYKVFCQTEYNLPIFFQDWWLDVVTDGNWDVVIVEQDNKIVACWPYTLSNKYFLKIITMPQFTKMLGCYVVYPKNQKPVNMHPYYKKMVNSLFDMLPDNDYFSQNFIYSFTNWMPLYWKGFSQTTKYSYVLEDIKNHDELFLNFRSNIKTDIKKAIKNKISITETDDIDIVYKMTAKTFKRQEKRNSLNLDLFRKLDEKCAKQNKRKIFIATDESSNIHSAAYVIYDNLSAYYIIGGGDDKLRNSGATSLLIWESIKESSIHVDNFDFEGSMIEPIEKFFNGFNGKQKQYFSIKKSNNFLIKIIHTIKDM